MQFMRTLLSVLFNGVLINLKSLSGEILNANHFNFFFFMHGHGLMSQCVEWLKFCTVLSKVLQNTDIKKKKKKENKIDR
jgi:hypothetical protein